MQLTLPVGRSGLIGLFLAFFICGQVFDLPQPVTVADSFGVSFEADVAPDDNVDQPGVASGGGALSVFAGLNAGYVRYGASADHRIGQACISSTWPTGPPA